MGKEKHARANASVRISEIYLPLITLCAALLLLCKLLVHAEELDIHRGMCGFCTQYQSILLSIAFLVLFWSVPKKTLQKPDLRASHFWDAVHLWLEFFMLLHFQNFFFFFKSGEQVGAE